MHALGKWTGLEVVEAWTLWDGGGYTDGSELFKDTVAVLKKPAAWKGLRRPAMLAPKRGWLSRLIQR